MKVESPRTDHGAAVGLDATGAGSVTFIIDETSTSTRQTKARTHIPEERLIPTPPFDRPSQPRKHMNDEFQPCSSRTTLIRINRTIHRDTAQTDGGKKFEIGRASCRERE